MEITFKKILPLLMLSMAALLSACQKQATDASQKPVVIAYLMAGQPVSVKVYAQKALTDTANYGAPITGLQLSVSDGSKTVKLSETATGTYTYSDLTFLVTGKTYSLSFTYQNNVISSTTLMPAKAVNYTASATTITIPAALSSTIYMDSIASVFKWYNADSLYHVLVFKNDDNAPWNLHPDRNSQVNFTINVQKTDNYSFYYRSFNYLGVYRAILYSVNKEYADVLTSNANTSSQRLTEPPTNVNNGYGIFTAIQADTIKLTILQ